MQDFDILKSFAFRIYFKIYRFLKVKKIQSIYGPIFYENYKDSTFKYYILGSYGKYFYNFLKNFNNEYCFIDIGANQGLFTLIAAKNFLCKKIIAFEPVEYSFNRLCDNILLNKVESKIILEKKAIFSIKEKMHMSLDLAHTGISSIESYSEQGSKNLVQVDAIGYEDLEKIFSKIKQKKIDIKIDVEGSEEVILGELVKTSIWERVEYIYLEVNDFPGYKNFIEKNKFYEVYIGNGSVYDVMLRRNE